MNILIIGGGNMGLTYAKSFLEAHVMKAEDLMILEKSEERAAHLATQNVGTVYGSAADCLDKADLIVFAVKPQDTPNLFPILKPYVDDQQVFLSIMAGVRYDGIYLIRRSDTY